MNEVDRTRVETFITRWAGSSGNEAFQKKTQKTAKKNIEIGQKRYQQLLQNRLNSRGLEP